jgi:hypothetical protein
VGVALGKQRVQLPLLAKVLLMAGAVIALQCVDRAVLALLLPPGDTTDILFGQQPIKSTSSRGERRISQRAGIKEVKGGQRHNTKFHSCIS